MAYTIKRLAPNGKEYYNVTSSDDLLLREAFAGAVSSFLLTIDGSDSFSISVVGAASGYGFAAADMYAIPYQKLSEATIDIAAGTAITANDNYVIRGDGMDVILDITITSGTLDVYVTPLLG